MGFWLVTLVLVLGALAGQQALTLLNQSVAFRQAYQKNMVSAVATAQSQYRQETGTYPVSLSTLSAVNGYEWLRTVLPSDQGGLQAARSAILLRSALSGSISDGTWTFQRALLFAPFDIRTLDADYLAQNTCQGGGTAPFATATDWCPAVGQAVTWREETRSLAGGAQTDGRANMGRTLAKFGSFFNTSGGFPVGGPATLTALAGGPASAAGCSGTYVWNQIPLGCEDLFSIWGTPVTYNRVASNLVALTADSPFRDGAGAAIVVAAELGI